MFVCRKLIVDDNHELFDANGMEYMEFKSDYPRVREITRTIVESCPPRFQEDNLLEQQLSEIIKNAIKHGNEQNPEKRIKVWFDFRKRVRFIVEDEGKGFTDLERWNEFYRQRQFALHTSDFERFMELASYSGPLSLPEDGGNSLIAALEYWNGGMIYNDRRNKVGVIRWYSGGFTSDF